MEVDGPPDRIEILHNGRIVASADGSTNTVHMDPLLLGAGPVRVYGIARYADGMRVQSRPLDLEVQRAYPSPALQTLRARKDLVGPDWSQSERTGGGVEEIGENGRLFTPASTNTVPDLILFGESSTGLRTLAARITIPSTRSVHPQSEMAGLVFGYQDAENYGFFMLNGGPSAWAFGRRRNGRMEYAIERGALMLNGTRHHIEVIFDKNIAVAHVNGETIARWADATTKGRAGVLAIRQPVLIEDLVYQVE
jgi:hypothetical protein